MGRPRAESGAFILFRPLRSSNNLGVAQKTEEKVCERCGRRFTEPKIVLFDRCTICDGKLISLDEALDRGVPENGNR